DEFHFDFDPCPYPRPGGWDGLKMSWGNSTFLNPPFTARDGLNGKGPTAFVRKAIKEHRAGKQIILLLPVQSYINLLLEAGAEIRSMGRIRWLEVDTKKPWEKPGPVACFILKAIKS
ncbi:unnamed protein product, partial [marine sediment metagenome]